MLCARAAGTPAMSMPTASNAVRTVFIPTPVRINTRSRLTRTSIRRSNRQLEARRLLARLRSLSRKGDAQSAQARGECPKRFREQSSFALHNAWTFGSRRATPIVAIRGAGVAALGSSTSLPNPTATAVGRACASATEWCRSSGGTRAQTRSCPRSPTRTPLDRHRSPCPRAFVARFRSGIRPPAP